MTENPTSDKPSLKKERLSKKDLSNKDLDIVVLKNEQTKENIFFNHFD